MSERKSLWKYVSSFAFVLTGVGVALPGALLPALLAVRHLSDSRGGVLLMVAKATSTLAALLVRDHPRRAAATGIAITAAALLGLAFGPFWAALPLFALYGTGLGPAMSGINIFRSREVPAADCSREMNRLNMLWAAGACLTPAIALHSLRTIRVTTTFADLGVVFLVTACVFGAMAAKRDTAPEALAMGQALTRRVPLIFCLFAAIAVGMESSICAWLTLYVRRGGHAAGVAASANMFFWAGLLLSRAAHAHRWFTWLRSRAGLGMQLLLTASALLLLLLVYDGAGLLAAALLAGLGIGPLYPTVLALVLPRYRSNLIFLAAGAGSAALPWVIGFVSTATGSLHAALWILSIPVTLLVVLAVALRKHVGGGFLPAEPMLTCD